MVSMNFDSFFFSVWISFLSLLFPLPRCELLEINLSHRGGRHIGISFFHMFSDHRATGIVRHIGWLPRMCRIPPNVPYVWYTYVLTMYVVHSIYVCRCWGPTLCWAILRTKVTSLSTSLIWTQLNFSAHLTASKLAQSSALLHIRPSSFFSAPYNICSFQDSTEYWALLVGEVRGEISNPSDIELEGTEDTREIGHLQDYECCSMCHRGYLSFNDINPM